MDYDKTWHRIIDVITSAVLVILTSKCTSTLNGVFMENTHVKKFAAIFKTIARHENRYTVFSDFVSMAAVSIENAFLRSTDLEEEYMGTIGKYCKDDQLKFPQLLAEVTLGLEYEHCDLLGAIFMELEIGSKQLGQFFTPYHLSKMMAQVTFGDGDILATKNFIKVSEPACGAGGMIIAFAEAMLNKKFNPQQQMWFSCVDIDRVAAKMAYVQLSILGLSGEVIIGNTLSLEFSRVMRTPMHYLYNWNYKLKNQEREVNKPVVSDVLKSVITPPIINKEPKPLLEQCQFDLFGEYPG